MLPVHCNFKLVIHRKASTKLDLFMFDMNTAIREVILESNL